MSIYPKKANEARVIKTPQLNQMINRTLSVHGLSSLVVWSGPSRLGKTTTASYLNKLLNNEFTPDNNDAFRSVHYQVGEIVGKNSQKKGVRSLYEAAVGPMDNSVYREQSPEELAKMTVEGLRLKNIQMILIDEAGTIDLSAIRGMVLVRDIALMMGWTLTLVFIGMDDLPIKLIRLPQISNRINEWCYFKPFSAKETLNFLVKLEPYFSNYSWENEDQRLQIEFIHEQFGGRPGLIVPFLTRLKNRLYDELDGQISLEGLMTIHVDFLRHRKQAVVDSRQGHVGKTDTDLDMDFDELLKEGLNGVFNTREKRKAARK